MRRSGTYARSGCSIVRITTVLVILLLSAGASTAMAARATWPWTMYQGDAGHTGWSRVSLPRKPRFRVLWRKKLSALPLSAVVGESGRIYVSARASINAPGPGLFALNRAGRLLWKKDFGDVFSVNPPSCKDGVVYLQTCNHDQDSYFRAYRGKDGQLLYRAAYSAQWMTHEAPALSVGLGFVNGGYYGGMYCYELATGRQVWFTELSFEDGWTPAVDTNFALAYLDGRLIALDLIRGTQSFEIENPDSSVFGAFTPVSSGSGPVAVIDNGRLVLFDVLQHKLLWSLDNQFTGRPAFADGLLFSIEAGSLTVRRGYDAELYWAWEIPGGGSITGAPLVTNTHIFICSPDHLYVLDPYQEKKVWSAPFSGRLSLVENVLYVAQDDGQLIAIQVSP